MKTYREWSPTTFDIKGLNLPDQQDWLVLPVLVTRDTPEGSIDYSNFGVAKERLTAEDPDQQDWEAHSFNHWACGYFDILIVRPGSSCARIATEIEESLANYPILDEDDHSEREYEVCTEDWGQRFGAAERAAETVAEVFELGEVATERLRTCDWDGDLRFYEFLRSYEVIETAYEGDDPYFRVYKPHLEHSKMSRSDLAKFLWSVRHG